MRPATLELREREIRYKWGSNPFHLIFHKDGKLRHCTSIESAMAIMRDEDILQSQEDLSSQPRMCLKEQGSSWTHWGSGRRRGSVSPSRGEG